MHDSFDTKKLYILFFYLPLPDRQFINYQRKLLSKKSLKARDSVACKVLFNNVLILKGKRKRI